MKRIKITESQKKRLLEAYQPKFSFKKLEELYETKGCYAQYQYCKEMLGNVVNCGSSRVIFTLDDNTVLKLVGGEVEAGIDQNITEYKLYEKCNSPLLPRIYYHDKHYSFLVCESVLPAQTEDFEKILGIPWYHYYSQNSEQRPKNYTYPTEHGDKEVGYNKYFDNIKKPYESSEDCLDDILLYIEDRYVLKGGEADPHIEKIIKKTPWLQAMVKLVSEYGVEDFNQIDNFGIVNRDGNPMIVLLDSGLDEEVYNTHYASD